MMGHSICRIGNYEYLAHRAAGRSFSIATNETLNAELALLVSQKAAKKIQGTTKLETLRFRFGGKKWKVVPINEFSLLQRLLRYLNIFSAKPVAGRRDRYRLKVAHLPMRRQNNKIKRTLAAHAFLKQKVCNQQEYQSGVREIVAHNGTLNSFTEIAAQAFQKHESFFCLNDNSSIVHMDYRIVVVDNRLQLVYRESLENDPKLRFQAVNEWRKLYIHQYGEKKFNELVSFYQLDFEDGLTAEHIYRGNIFASNVEWGDLSDFAKRVLSDEALTGSEQAAIDAWPQCKEILKQVKGEIKELSPEHFAQLIESVTPKNEKYLTGRKIRYPIASNYTIGELKKYKPWIDQQELSQVFSQLKQSKSWASYQELLSHVVVKKHLLRRYSENDMRLGVLIPAPAEKAGGPVRYYAVTQCISNGGILSYILESACGDSSLPTIKLYRSTTTDAYAVNFSDTIVNDLNHLNSPGYLGIRDIDGYERKFFKERTIPLWVGYMELAKTALKEDRKEEAKALLSQANTALRETLEKKIKKPTFLELLKEHDRPLNAVFFPYTSSSRWEFLKNHRRDVLGKLINKYLHRKIEATKGDVKRDAQRLLDYLKMIQQAISKENPLYNQIQKVNDDLNFWFIQNTKMEIDPVERAALEKFENYAGQSLGSVEEWLNAMDHFARSNKEDIASKKAVDLQMSGHSLGGACAGVAMARYIAIDGRMPLPGHSCSNYLFDAPGINREDNLAFLAFGKKHGDLFKKSQVSFNVFQRHEAGDVVPVSGGMGVGATDSLKEEEELLNWCHFDVAVNRRRKRATYSEIADSVATHGTRFLNGCEGNDYQVKKISPHELGLFNKGSNQSLKGKEKRAFKRLKASKWKLGAPIKRIFKERLRQSFSLPLLFFRYSVTTQQVQHVFPECQIDNHGVLCQVLK